MNINCILCKYRNDREGCHKVIYTSSWDCPSLSNLWYGKLSYWFPFTLIYKLQTKIWIYLANKQYDREEE